MFVSVCAYVRVGRRRGKYRLLRIGGEEGGVGAHWDEVLIQDDIRNRVSRNI